MLWVFFILHEAFVRVNAKTSYVNNDSLKRGIFPDELKLAEVTPLFKKADPFDKIN